MTVMYTGDDTRVIVRYNVKTCTFVGKLVYITFTDNSAAFTLSIAKLKDIRL